MLLSNVARNDTRRQDNNLFQFVTKFMPLERNCANFYFPAESRLLGSVIRDRSPSQETRSGTSSSSVIEDGRSFRPVSRQTRMDHGIPTRASSFERVRGPERRWISCHGRECADGYSRGINQLLVHASARRAKKIYARAPIWACVYVSRIHRHKSHGFLMAAMMYDPEECTRFVGPSSCSSNGRGINRDVVPARVRYGFYNVSFPALSTANLQLHFAMLMRALRHAKLTHESGVRVGLPRRQ